MVVISDTVKAICYFIQIALTWIVIVPALIYFHRRLYSIDSIMVRKRYPNILKFQGYLTFGYYLFGNPIMTLDWTNFAIFEGAKQKMISRINCSFYILWIFGIFTTAGWRFWHIYFDLKYASSQKNSEWKYHLDPSLVKHNFWLTHKKDYGSKQYTKKLAFLYYVFNVSIIICFYHIIIENWYEDDMMILVGHLNAAFWTSIIAVAPIIMYWHTPEYQDHFFIREEMKIVSVTSAVMMGLASCFISIALYSAQVFMMLLPVQGIILFSSMAGISFYFIPTKIVTKELHILLAGLNRHNTSSGRDESSTVGGNPYPNKLGNEFHIGGIVHRLSSNNHDRRKCHKLVTILSTERTFKVFMQHLAKEFSMECLLCFIEAIQYKFAIKKRFDIIDPNAVEFKVNVSRTPMAEVAPSSSIIKEGFQNITKYKKNDDPSTLITEAKKVALKLNRKYIENGSELEVNISYDARQRLLNLMGDESWWMHFNITAQDLFTLYDDVATEMFRLMDGSFTRFKTLPAFDTVIKELENNQ